MEVRRAFARRTNIGGTGLAGTTETAIVAADTAVNIMLYSLKTLRKTGASGTARQARIYTTTGEASGGLSEHFRSAAAVAPATLVNTVGINVCVRLAAGATLFLKMDGDAADTFDWDLWYEVLL